MRTRIWNNLSNVKFKALYCDKYSSFAGTCGRCYSFFLSIASASSVAAWAAWKQYPGLWAAIVASAQVFHIAKPYIPFLGKEKDFLEISYEFEMLYLLYERLWYDYENNRIGLEETEKLFYKYRQREIEIERAHRAARCIEFKFLIQKAQNDTYKVLSMNFRKGEHLNGKSTKTESEAITVTEA